VKLGHIALDGMKLQANASKHKTMSYGRMKQELARPEQVEDNTEGAEQKTPVSLPEKLVPIPAILASIMSAI